MNNYSYKAPPIKIMGTFEKRLSRRDLVQQCVIRNSPAAGATQGYYAYTQRYHALVNVLQSRKNIMTKICIFEEISRNERY